MDKKDDGTADDKKAKELMQKYDPEYFISDLMNIFVLLSEKTDLIKEMEFTPTQKAQIAGSVLGIATIFVNLNKIMISWGFGQQV